MRRNPHTTEWVISGIRPFEEAGLLKLAGILVSWGYGSSYSWRRVTEGKNSAVGITFRDIPDVSVPDSSDYSTARAPGGASRYASNLATISSYLGQYGRVSGTTTYSRTPAPLPHRKKPRSRQAPSPQEIEQAAFALRVQYAQAAASRKRPLPELLQKGYLQAKGRKNPSKVKLPPLFDGDVYDPREEAIRAVARGTGGMWGVAVGRYGQSHSPQEIIQRSWERYQDVDHLIRARQEYELLLGKGRQSGPLRVTSEPTMAGLRYFVWPLPAGRPVPHAHRTRQAAENEMALRYRDRTPIAQALPPKPYTRGELAEWLPPDHVFEGRVGTPSKASQKPRPAKSRLPNEGLPTPPAVFVPPTEVDPTTRLLRAYHAFHPEWHKDAELMSAFRRGAPPPTR